MGNILSASFPHSFYIEGMQSVHFYFVIFPEFAVHRYCKDKSGHMEQEERQPAALGRQRSMVAGSHRMRHQSIHRF